MEKKSSLNRVGAIISLIGFVFGVFVVAWGGLGSLTNEGPMASSWFICLVLFAVSSVLGLIACIMMLAGKKAKIFTFVSLVCTILFFAGIAYGFVALNDENCFFVAFAFIPAVALIGNILSLIGLKDVA